MKLARKKERIREELSDMIKNRIIEEVINSITRTEEFESAVESIVSGDTDPYTACEQLVFPKLADTAG